MTQSAPCCNAGPRFKQTPDSGPALDSTTSGPTATRSAISSPEQSAFWTHPRRRHGRPQQQRCDAGVGGERGCDLGSASSLRKHRHAAQLAPMEVEEGAFVAARTASWLAPGGAGGGSGADDVRRVCSTNSVVSMTQAELLKQPLCIQDLWRRLECSQSAAAAAVQAATHCSGSSSEIDPGGGGPGRRSGFARRWPPAWGVSARRIAARGTPCRRRARAARRPPSPSPLLPPTRGAFVRSLSAAAQR